MKNKLYLVITCLVLTVFGVLAVKPVTAEAATATDYQTLRFSGENTRVKVGSRYFWLSWTTDGKCQVRQSTSSKASGYIVKTFSDTPYNSGAEPISFVTNGDMVYYMTSGKALYSYNASTRVTTKLASLSDTLKKRIGSSYVAANVVGSYNGTLFISAKNYNTDEVSAIYSYKSGTLRYCTSGSFCTATSRYLFIQNGSWLGRYDMSAADFEYISPCTGEAVVYYGKLYMARTASTYDKFYIRVYDPAALTYTTLASLPMTDTSSCSLEYIYSGYIYYTKYSGDTAAYYKLNLSTKVKSSTTSSTFDANYFKSVYHFWW